MNLRNAVLSAALASAAISNSLRAEAFVSHPPQRPLPVASQRPLPAGEVHVVDPAHGDDAKSGTTEAPWRTLDHALSNMPQGGILCLRGGVHYGHFNVHAAARKERPLIIRSWPGELAVLDGGEPAFALEPEAAWEAVVGGAPDEFRSTKTYPTGHAASEKDEDGDGDGEVLAMGRFVDSMTPLHGYRFHGDLMSDNPWWNIQNKVGTASFVYCGPGVWQNGKTGRIHCRLAATKLPSIGENNYTGISDPRKTPLCIATLAAGPVLTLEGARQVVLQDIVIRGSVGPTMLIRNSADIVLDGVTVYGGGQGITVKDSAGLRMTNSACRGPSAPWVFRGALKYRSVEARLFAASSWMPSGADNREFEIAYCEFTDSEDGVFLGNVHGVRFHHNLLENVNDDGLFLTAPTGYDGHVAGGDVKIWQNRLSGCLTMFAFGVGHGRQLTLPDRVQTSDGIWITRNVIDFRRPVHYQWPKDAADANEPKFRGRLAGDHGSPAWEPMWVYHNTIIGGEVQRPDFGSSGLGAGMGKGTTRDVLNNLLCVDVGPPGTALPKDNSLFATSGNILWSFDPAAPDAATSAAKLAKSSAPAAAANRVVDPGFKHYSTNWREPADLGLQANSAAANQGVAVPADWFDPLHAQDAGAPDIGAIPVGAEAWRVGVHGRLDVFGRTADAKKDLPAIPWAFADDHPDHGPRPDAPRAIVVRGYPSWDAPILAYLLRRRGVNVEEHDRQPFQLTAKSLGDAKLLIYDGSLTRARLTPDTLGAEDINALERWMQAGGTLFLCSQRADIFKSDPGRAFLSRHLGDPPRSKAAESVSTLPQHPWLAHLKGPSPSWLGAKGGSPLATINGESIVTAGPNLTLLWQNKAAAGRMFYLGWTIGGQLTDNRRGSLPETDAAIRDQVRILEAMIDGWLNTRPEK